jgi:hypothetical protein
VSKKYDRCVKTKESPDIWMVRESTKSRVKFETWEEYLEEGMPPYAVVDQEELEEYREASYFRG